MSKSTLMPPATFRSIRLSAGHTQASLALWAGVTVRQVQMIEAGDRKPSGPFIRLMTLLGDGVI